MSRRDVDDDHPIGVQITTKSTIEGDPEGWISAHHEGVLTLRSGWESAMLSRVEHLEQVKDKGSILEKVMVATQIDTFKVALAKHFPDKHNYPRLATSYLLPEIGNSLSRPKRPEVRPKTTKWNWQAWLWLGMIIIAIIMIVAVALIIVYL